MNYYVEIFRIFKEEFEKNERILGESLKTEDIRYLETLTRSKIDELVNTFMSETDKVKKIYSQYGKNTEIARVDEAQRALQSTIDKADSTVGSLRVIESQVAGGYRSMKKGRLPRYVGRKVRISKIKNT